MAKSDRVEGTIRSFLRRSKKQDDGLTRGTKLYSDGIGLDSLATAELSAVLEDELGSDPFSDGQTPQTVGEIIEYYEASEPADGTGANSKSERLA